MSLRNRLQELATSEHLLPGQRETAADALFQLDCMERALRLLLKRASAWRQGQNDYSAWKGCTAETIGEVLNEARRALVFESPTTTRESERT